MVELRTINEHNYEECLNLSASVANADFVDPVAWSLAEAWVFYNDSRPFAIYADDMMVGYVLMYIGEENHQIINFMIDSRFQKRGYGVVAARLCVDYLCKECKANKISLPVKPENIAAQRLWSRVGFEITDDLEDGYLFMRLYIPKY
ncbi:GNAT family N-acetyltransferase [Alkaliphilus pronyensis]|uniref:GNAT family N-acetyltransferase n=1 Tax=Alkaliphilus pronyensis TaxID=1482732 RepID=A0A6I0EWA2_9FIRM|nr:GNAT family N-acetyltransferase [Alkaliphilus pronyensis]KAB3531290.1 GNAT family N-acetyltransferase [Alkaliphilus pronyensis]